MAVVVERLEAVVRELWPTWAHVIGTIIDELPEVELSAECLVELRV